MTRAPDVALARLGSEPLAYHEVEYVHDDPAHQEMPDGAVYR
jgi:hypothetical protein